MLKIFHTADVHLDSPFSSLPPDLSEKRRRELRVTFRRMMEYAAEQKVDLVLIPGDLFDSTYVSRDTADMLCECFSALSCPVVISPGNHDPYTPHSIYVSGKLPGNVYIFKTENPSCFDFPELGAAVWGSAFTRESYEHRMLFSIYSLKENRINILCQHGDTRDMLSTKAPLNPRDIAYKGFTYAALGHIHIPPEPVVINGTTIAYPGCPEGRSFDEPGFGGALLVTIDNGTTALEKITFAMGRYMTERLDVTGCSDDNTVAAKISDLISERGYGSETSLRIILEGGVPIEYRPDTEHLSQKCRAALAVLDIRDRTIPSYDTAYLEEDVTLRGAFYRLLYEKLQSDDENIRRAAADALRYGLAALDGRPII